MANGSVKIGGWTSLAWLALSALAGLSLGCGQEDPEDPPPGELQPYHPLVAGSSWQYDHGGRWDEVVTLSEADLDGQPAFLMSDSPNPSDDLRSDAIIASVGGRVVRLAKDEFLVDAAGNGTLTTSATYGVGFTRFNEDWANQAVGYTETPEYVRVETRAGEAARPPENRRHTFEVMNLHAEVQTPIGPFDCIEIKRTKDWEAEEEGGDASDADAKTFWFARGVGKVQERNDESGNTEVLTAYEIPGL